VSFLNPWIAAGIAAVVIPALLILYFLKLRRREEVVPSTLLWKRAVQDLQVNAPFQRLRKSLLLFLQLAVLALALFALARPIVQTTAADEERVVLLIDRSASMNAREGDHTRLDDAKEQAVRLVKTFNRRGGGWRSFWSFGGAEIRTQVMVISFADRATMVSPFTTNTSDLVDVIRRIEPSDGRTDLREALALAEAYMAPPTRLTPGMESLPESKEAPAKLVLISDGKVAHLDKVVLKSGSMELLPIGQAKDNVGITALRTQRNYERPEMLGVFLTVRNYSPESVNTDVSLYVDNTLATVKTLSLTARPAEHATTASAPASAPTSAETPAAAPADEGSAVSLGIDLPLDTAAILEARLSRNDALAADNSAFAVVPPPRRMSVLVVTQKNFFLDFVLSGLPLEKYPFVTPEQYESSPDQYEVGGQSKFDVVIFDKVQPGRLPAGNYLFLGATPRLDAFKPGLKIEKHMLIWWDETHPVLRHVPLEQVYVEESLTLQVPQQAEVLVEGPKGPVLARYAQDGRHCMVLTFAIENSTWWSKPSFPVFMYNAIRYLGSGGAEVEAGAVRPGETLRVPAATGADHVTVVRPTGAKVSLRPDSSGTAYFGGTDRVGIYRAEGGAPGRDQFAVNLEDDWESDIAPAERVVVDREPLKSIDAIKTATPEIWRWFVGAALLLILFEWYIYNRRVML
jgi:hypothetical protein